MSLVKVCPVCNTKNVSTTPVCANCKKPLIGVKVTDDSPQTAPIEEETLQNQTVRETFTSEYYFQFHDSFDIRISMDCVLGREGTVEQAYFSRFDTVSRRHCEIRIRDGALFIRDLNSTNGVFINGSQIQPDMEVRIEKGSRVGLGKSVEFDVR